MHGKPNIILTCSYSVATGYSDYINYMSRKEALASKEKLTPDEQAEEYRVNQMIKHIEPKMPQDRELHTQSDPTIKGARGVQTHVVENFWGSVNEQDYGKYIGYMVRIQALASKEKLSPEETNELQRVKKGAAKYDHSNSVGRDKTLIGYWTNEQDKVKVKDLNHIRQKMRDAEKNGSVLWQDVVSFDNNFLARQHIYDPKTQELNEGLMHKAAKKMMSTLTENEKLNNPFWTVAIHRNTDNIHLHFSIVEEKNSRRMVENNGKLEPRGNFKQSTIYKMKSSFSNELLDLTDVQKQITSERQNVRDHIAKNLADGREQPVVEKMLKKLKRNLPDDKRKWQYGRLQKIDPKLTKQIDRITDRLLKNDPNYTHWSNLVGDVDQIYREQYGQTKNTHKNYSKNEEADLRKRTGNKLLSELKKDQPEQIKNTKVGIEETAHDKKNEDHIEAERPRDRNKPGSDQKAEPKAKENQENKQKGDEKHEEQTNSRPTYKKKKPRDRNNSSQSSNESKVSDRYTYQQIGKRTDVTNPGKYLHQRNIMMRDIRRISRRKQNLSNLQIIIQKDFEVGLTTFDKVKATHHFKQFERHIEFEREVDQNI